MLKILSKDLKTFFLFSAILMIPAFILWNIWKSDKSFPVAVFVQLAFTYLITILTVLLNEQDEDTNNGYRFFQTLPIKKGYVTLIKFLIPVIAVTILALVNRGIYSVFPVGEDILRISDAITIAFSVLYLLNSGLIIIGVYFLGYTKFIQFVSGFIAIFVFGSFIISKLDKFNSANIGDIANSIEKWLLNGDHYLFILCGLLIYIVMGVLANRIEKK